jgi:hypothetical protein
MAQNAQVTRADRKAELISELAWTRAELTRTVQDARNDLDLVAHFKQSFVQRKTAWLTGAAVTGWILSRLPGRRKKPSPPTALPLGAVTGSSGRTAFWLAILGALLKLFKPFLTALATQKMNEIVARKGGVWRKFQR